MAVRTDLTTATGNPLYRGADNTVRVTIAGTGSIAGQTFVGYLRSASGVISGTTNIADATARIVDWLLADTDTDDLPLGYYDYAIWRVDAGSEYPVAYGAAELVNTAKG